MLSLAGLILRISIKTLFITVVALFKKKLNFYVCDDVQTDH